MDKKELLVLAVLAITIGTSKVSLADLHDRGGGLIYDDELDITWLQNVKQGAGTIYDEPQGTRPGTNNDGMMSWFRAMEWADNLEYYDSVRDVVWDDWRLPAIHCWVNGESFNHERRTDGTSDVGVNITSPCNELSYMYYVTLGNLASKNLSGELQEGKGLVDDPLNPNDESLFIGLFEGRNSPFFWTSKIRPDNDSNAFDFRADNGNVAFGNWYYDRLAWAVRDGDVADGSTPPPPPPPLPVDPDIAVGQMVSDISAPSVDGDTGNIKIKLAYYGTTDEGVNLWQIQEKVLNSNPIVDDNNGTISATNIHLPSVIYRGLDTNQNIWIDMIPYDGESEVELWIIDNYGVN